MYVAAMRHHTKAPVAQMQFYDVFCQYNSHMPRIYSVVFPRKRFEANV